MLNNLRLALSLVLKFHRNLAKSLKPKSQNVFGTNSYRWKSYRGKPGMRYRFLPALFPLAPIFNRGNCYMSKKKLQKFDGFIIECLHFRFPPSYFFKLSKLLLLEECLLNLSTKEVEIS